MTKIIFCIIILLVTFLMLFVVVYAQHIANKEGEDEEDKTQ